jgi:glycosyltransferase involved in cell wall biosynthesis
LYRADRPFSLRRCPASIPPADFRHGKPPENQEVVAGVGFTFKHGDQSDLTRLLDLLIRDPALRRQMTAKGEQHIQQQYLWPDVARSIEKAYYKVLDRNHQADMPVADSDRRSSVA